MTQPYLIQMPMDFTFKSVNAYLFTQPEPVLVDCGLNMPASRANLEAGLAEHGLSLQDISRVIVTHPHIDHFGLAGAIAEEAGAEIWVSDLAYEAAADMQAMGDGFIDFLLNVLAGCGFPEHIRQAFAAYMQTLAELRRDVPRENLVRFPIDAELNFGGLDWQVVYAPGHSNRQTCFYQPETRQCLAADMLLPKAPAPVVEPSLEDDTQRSRGLPELLRSFHKFAEMEIDVVYPGHGEIFSGHRELIDRQLDRIQERKLKCLGLIRRGCSSVPELVETMYRYLPPEGRLSGLGMLIGYLDLLIEEGAVTTEQSGQGLQVLTK